MKLQEDKKSDIEKILKSSNNVSISSREFDN